MKKTPIKTALILLLAMAGHSAYAQCDKTVVLKSLKTNFLDSRDSVTRSLDQQATITFSKTTISINPKSDDREMTGTVTSYICDWKTPFKTGKTTIKATLEDKGTQQHATLTIIGIEGKITLTYQAAERPDIKIQVVADKFEEKKTQ